MTQINVFLNDEENLQLYKMKQKWKLSKVNIIKRLIAEYKIDTPEILPSNLGRT